MSAGYRMLIASLATFLIAGTAFFVLTTPTADTTARPTVLATHAANQPALTTGRTGVVPAVRLKGSAPIGRSTPTRIQIPSIGVDSTLMALGLNKDGTLEVPPGPTPAGWYTRAPTPGELGPAIIVGHVAWNGVPGVFKDLHDVLPGARIVALRADGSHATFQVRAVRKFEKSKFPTQLVYGDLDHSAIRLVTCDGFDPKTHRYDENLVVFADLVS